MSDVLLSCEFDIVRSIFIAFHQDRHSQQHPQSFHNDTQRSHSFGCVRSLLPEPWSLWLLQVLFQVNDTRNVTLLHIHFSHHCIDNIACCYSRNHFCSSHSSVPSSTLHFDLSSIQRDKREHSLRLQFNCHVLLRRLQSVCAVLFWLDIELNNNLPAFAHRLCQFVFCGDNWTDIRGVLLLLV